MSQGRDLETTMRYLADKAKFAGTILKKMPKRKKEGALARFFLTFFV